MKSNVSGIIGDNTGNDKARRRLIAVWTWVGALLLFGVAVYVSGILAIPIGIIIWAAVFVFMKSFPPLVRPRYISLLMLLPDQKDPITLFKRQFFISKLHSKSILLSVLPIINRMFSVGLSCKDPLYSIKLTVTEVTIRV